MVVRRDPEAARQNHEAVYRIARLLALPPALVQVAVAHIAGRLGSTPGAVIGSVEAMLGGLAGGAARPRKV